MAWEVVYHVAISILIAAALYFVGKALKQGLIRLFRRLGFDDWFRNFNIGKALLRSGYTPGEFFSSVAAWLMYILAILAAIYYFSDSLGLLWLRDAAWEAATVYIFGFVKFFVIAIVGFILVDSFVEYVYKGAVSRTEFIIAPVAEYIRVILYLVVVTFALEQGGINVATLSVMLTPITWGLAAAIIVMVVVEALKKR
ncbi:MAG: hypothetical protein QXK71_06430 [Pyrobaculum sp.]|jgi:hypothetical protein